ncbi:hypothetical protein [Granulicatella seriolae]|uniref:ABC transporter permease n=1 Tax=Granulicatella seriolae TaxID=2967226 RepID=A0ABT1WLM0_9LACT|nr:hypothetical protein [Granulicatella seriolae]
MEKEQSAFISWIKAHKKELIFSGITITTLIVFILGMKNMDSIKELWAALQESMSKKSIDKSIMKIAESPVSLSESLSTTSINLPPIHNKQNTIFDVSGHPRNLPMARNASPEKIAMATELGINLLPQQTWVNTYTKGLSAA